MNLHWREQVGLMVLAAVLLAYTLTRPTATLEQQKHRFVYVFDISQSMNVSDVGSTPGEVTRLDFAKRAAVASLRALPCGSEIGVALFSGHRVFLLITPIEICANYLELSTIIEQVDWRMTWKRRSEIAKGIFKSIELLLELEEETRLAFFTDGHEAPPIRPDLPPVLEAEPGVIAGLVVGVGGATPAPIPKFDETGKALGFWSAEDVTRSSGTSSPASGSDLPVPGNEHLSSLREPYLLELAHKTGLGYHRLETEDALSRALGSAAFGIPVVTSTDLRWLFALVAITAILASVLLQRPRPAS